jgi:CelD/BcsL family acetyltransferase involved in cellulose biosynthesis
MEKGEQTIAALTEPVLKMDTHCSIRVVQTEQEFDQLERTWDELLSTCGASIFQTFEWLRTWWEHFGEGRRLHCLVFSSDGQVVGIAPMFKTLVKAVGVRIARYLQFMGSPLSDYTDIIVRTGYEPAVLDTFAWHLRDSWNEWDVLDIEDVNESSVVVQVLPQMLRNHGILLSMYQGNVCPALPLPTTWDAFLQGLGPNGRYNLRRKSKYLYRNFRTEVEVLESDTDDIVEGVDGFIKLHGDRWKSLGYPSAFDDETHRAFHTEVAKIFACRGWLRLFFLKVNGLRVASSFDFYYKGRIYMYQSNAHGPREIMKCSPGFLLNSIVIERGIKDGMRVFDFLRGDEFYKIEGMKAVPHKNWLIRGASPSRGGRLRYRMFLGHELLKKGRNRILQEYFGLKRLWWTKHPSVSVVVEYIVARLGILLRLARHYILRYALSSMPRN